MFTKDTPIMEVLQAKPKSKEIFIKYGMHCVGCLGSEFETLEMSARGHDVDLGRLLQELNALD